MTKFSPEILKIASTSLVIVSMLFVAIPASRPAAAQDLVATDSIASGSSAFVFRESSKKPQAFLAGGGNAFVREGAGGVRANRRTNTQIVSAAKKRRLAAAAARKRAMAAARTKKLKLSNDLAKAGENDLDAGRVDDAIKNFRASLSENPRNTRASSGLSEALTDQGTTIAGDKNSSAAIPALEEAVKLDKTNAEAFAKLGAVYAANGDFASAITNYSQAITLDKDLVALNAPLGIAYLETGDVGKADAALTLATRGAVETVDSKMLEGRIRLKQNRNNEALAAFDKALQLDPQNASAAYYRGQAYSRMDEPAKMIDSYKQALNLEPNYSPAAFDMGVAYYNAGDYKNAAASYEIVVSEDPANAQAHANLASCYRQLGRYPEANAQYKLASEKIKTDELYSEWGYCLGKVNDWNNASARLLTARDLNPVAINDSNIAWAYYNQAVEQEKTSPSAAKANLELSRSFASKAVQQDPKLDAAYLNLGSTENRLGNYPAAVAALKSALNLRSDWVIAMNQLGVGYRGMNNLADAISMFKRATDLDGNYTLGLFNLGAAYNASGDKKNARRIQDRLGKLDAALANTLGDVFKGKISVDGLTRGLTNEIPKVPHIPRVKLPF